MQSTAFSVKRVCGLIVLSVSDACHRDKENNQAAPRATSKIPKLPGAENLPEKRSIPGKGKIKIKISESSSLEQNINKETKVKEKVQTKENKQNTESSVKTQKRNLLVSSIIIIIIGLIVKYAFDHKNNLKKIWKSIKNKITLH